MIEVEFETGNKSESDQKNKWTKLALVIFSGTLLGISYSYFIYWLAWFALVPLLLAVDTLSPKKSFLYGFVSGLIQASILFIWIVNTAERFTGDPGVLGIVIMLGIVVYFASWLALWYRKWNVFVSFVCRPYGYYKKS